MKKLTVITGLFLFTVGTTIAQCIPDINFDGTGLTYSPAQLEPVFTCSGCGDQERIISIQTFADTTLSVELAPGNPPLDVQVFADFFRLDSIAGLPTGLTYITDAAFDSTFDAIENPQGYWINPGDTTNGFENTHGCVSVEGTETAWNAAVNGGPNNDGVYPLTLYIDARAANFAPAAIGGVVGFNTWLTDMGSLLDAFGDLNFTENGIRLAGPELIVSQSGVGVTERESEIGTLQVIPNPVSSDFVLTFNSSVSGLANVQVFDLSGKLIFTKQIKYTDDGNRVELRGLGLKSGFYLLSMSTLETTRTVRFVVD